MSLQETLRELEANKAPRPKPDIERVIELGLDLGLSDMEVEAVSRLCVKPSWFAQGFRLRAVQAWAILNVLEHQGLFAPIGVGWGKTIIGLRTAADFYRNLGKDKVLYLLPSKVYGQFTRRDISFITSRIELFDLPIHLLGRKTAVRRMQLSRSGKKGLYVMPYSMLSAQNAEEVLRNIAPGAIILDEAHYVKDRRSARSQRLFRYINKFNPNIVAMSGTITSKSILDYQHVMVAALGIKAPIPLTPSAAMDWAMIVDTNADPHPTYSRKLDPLIHWAQGAFDAGQDGAIDLRNEQRSRHRLAYQYRIRSAPGVCFTDTQSAVGTSLYITNTPAYKPTKGASSLIPSAKGQPSNISKPRGWDELQRLMVQVEEEWIAPTGDDIDYGMHKHKWLNELSAGFYYNLVWPDPAKLSAKRGVSGTIAEDIIERSIVQHKAKQTYNKCLQKWLEVHAQPGLDTPLLVDRAIARESPKAKGPIVQLWQRMRALEFEGMVKRDSVGVRICDYKIQHAKVWAASHEHGIIWYKHREIGRWLSDTIPGLLPCGAGAVADAAILDSKGKKVGASIAAHNEGKNLQFHENQLILQSPREALATEQMLGRVHRPGQEADELLIHTCLTTEFDALNYAAMLNDALYIAQTTGIQMKVIYAGYEPRPKVFPPSVLLQRGFIDIEPLSSEGYRVLHDTFKN